MQLTDSSDDDELLNQLDTWLCEIKEAQIRNGLHILGELPASDKQVDTLVALLRLPRGDDAAAQGILHALVRDLALELNGEVFDPLVDSTEDWTGIATGESARISFSDRPGAAVADTRERLELLARNWSNSTCSQNGDLEACPAPHTAALLAHARTPACRHCSKAWIRNSQALVRGLGGEFRRSGSERRADPRAGSIPCPPGVTFLPSTIVRFRRRPPGPSASARRRRLIERHLQEHGDYPQQVGLSVWGTATMRTGGDDIAQAFALMGIRPVWAPGSQRVVDFEILPMMKLGRPRIDVTLRVSGFFRDAFPERDEDLRCRCARMLAEYEEPGGLNTDSPSYRRARRRIAANPDGGMDQASARGQLSRVRQQAGRLRRRPAGPDRRALLGNRCGSGCRLT